MKLTVDKELFQWEKGRYVNLILEQGDPTITYIQFYNGKNSYGPEIPVESGRARIPNSWLAEGIPIMAIACTGSIGNTKPIIRKEFNVIKRARPAYYYEYSDSSAPGVPDIPNIPDTPEPPDDDETNKDIVYDGGEEV